MNPPNGSKPFDLAAALAGDPVVTRDGRPVYRLVYDTKHMYGQPLVPYLSEGNDENTLHRHWSDGTYFLDKGESPFDLFMAPKTKKVWVNLYRNPGYNIHSGLLEHAHELTARNEALSSPFAPYYLKAVEVEVPV